jgi:ABC-type enterochelin transport system permease subunit
MRPLLIVGLVLIVLGILSLFVGIPHQHSSGIQVGDAKIGVQTQTSDRIPLPASVAIIIGGVVLAAVGGRPSR